VLEALHAIDLPCETLLLINNGSNDGSEKLIRCSGYPFIDLSRNHGIGYSYMLATDWALERNYDIIGVLAGNGKMLPSEMYRVLNPILDGEAEYVVGSRRLTGGNSPNIPLFRHVAIPLVNYFVKVITGITLTDATCGYRAWRLDLMKKAEFDWHASWLNTYGFEYYFFAKVILSHSVRWKEVPVTMHYPSKGERYSKIRPFIDWWAMLKPWIIARCDGKRFALS